MTRRSGAAKALVEQPGSCLPRAHASPGPWGQSGQPERPVGGPALRIVLFSMSTRLAPLAGARANRSLELQSRSLSVMQRYAARAIPRLPIAQIADSVRGRAAEVIAAIGAPIVQFCVLRLRCYCWFSASQDRTSEIPSAAPSCTCDGAEPGGNCCRSSGR